MQIESAGNTIPVGRAEVAHNPTMIFAGNVFASSGQTVDNVYSPHAKEQFLRAIKERGLTDEQIRDEVLAIITGHTTLDHFEIISGDYLLYLAEKLQLALSRQELGTSSKSPNGISTPIQVHSANTFAGSVDTLKNALYENNARAALLQFENNRKSLGFASSAQDIYQACEVVLGFAEKGWLKNSKPTIYQYPGSFNPFPHIGHAEMARLPLETHPSQDARTLVWTFFRNPHKPETADTFSERLRMLHMGFADEERISVLGIGGDSSGTRQHEQTRLVGDLSDGTSRYLIGGDAFIHKIQDAADGEACAQSLLGDENLEWYVSQRQDDDEIKLQWAIQEASKKYGCKIHIMPRQNTCISGTKVRGMTQEERQQYMSSALRSYINGYSQN